MIMILYSFHIHVLSSKPGKLGVVAVFKQAVKEEVASAVSTNKSLGLAKDDLSVIMPKWFFKISPMWPGELNEHTKLSMLRNAPWALSNFHRGEPHPNFNQDGDGDNAFDITAGDGDNAFDITTDVAKMICENLNWIIVM
ncbi:hypothetical protein ZIOFF_015433 [Zingiber officinale]|uniref:Uncharacterized protein n=1 Tax=Zingiber officinale TaxID=94328 RepID=A0A8J5HIS9_ZINOF|nr:hypothetical protein ZIOFF_015433 [Zingiber officinale]